MKAQIRIFAIAMLLTGISISTFAQVTATADGKATIVTPITITKAVDMNFGNVAVSATAGTVILSPGGVRTLTGGVTLPTVAGTVTAASFNITGEASYTYTIQLPSTDLTITSGSNNMSVNAFTSDPTPTGTLGSNGTQTLNVGATLNVLAHQPAGIYSSVTPFSVTVNYN
jgi:hypothetical protein